MCKHDYHANKQYNSCSNKKIRVVDHEVVNMCNLQLGHLFTAVVCRVIWVPLMNPVQKKVHCLSVISIKAVLNTSYNIFSQFLE